MEKLYKIVRNLSETQYELFSAIFQLRAYNEAMRMLVVEDEHRIAAAIKKGLEQESYAVDTAFNGTDGFDLASSEEYDLIILDLMLPGMDGLTICKELRKAHIHTPILILTAKGQVQDKVQGLDSGADDYLTKPFSFEELLARTRALVRRPKTTICSTLAVGTLKLDPKLYAVTRSGTDIHLSGKEFSLLEYLMRQANTIVSKDQIIAHVWNYEADILPNTIEVYIRNLRNKVDKPFNKEKPLIQTIRGFGYKIGN
jgi:two-component system, OmpR family, response regulator